MPELAMKEYKGRGVGDEKHFHILGQKRTQVKIAEVPQLVNVRCHYSWLIPMYHTPPNVVPCECQMPRHCTCMLTQG